MTGRLVLAATPMGDVGDASPRLRSALATADVVAAEDTRRTKSLASALEVTITGKIVSFYDQVEISRLPALVAGGLLDGPAALIGLRPGDVITHLNNQSIDSAKTFTEVAQQLPKNRSVSMRVLRQGRASFITFKLAE